MQMFVVVGKDRLAARRTGESEVTLDAPAAQDYAQNHVGIMEIVDIFTKSSAHRVDPIRQGQTVIALRPYTMTDQEYRDFGREKFCH